MNKKLAMLIMTLGLFGAPFSFAGEHLDCHEPEDKYDSKGRICQLWKEHNRAKAGRFNYVCRGSKDGKKYPVRLDLGNKTLTWLDLRFGNVRQVGCVAHACYRGTRRGLVAELSTATQGSAALEIQTKYGTATFDCQQRGRL